jgi:hypothetical protein
MGYFDTISELLAILFISQTVLVPLSLIWHVIRLNRTCVPIFPEFATRLNEPIKYLIQL